jgi:hypothetical protein
MLSARSAKYVSERIVFSSERMLFTESDTNLLAFFLPVYFANDYQHEKYRT